jgi:hypothetical protein
LYEADDGIGQKQLLVALQNSVFLLQRWGIEESDQGLPRRITRLRRTRGSGIGRRRAIAALFVILTPKKNDRKLAW